MGAACQHMPANLAALLQGEAGRLGVLLAQQLLAARLLGGRAALAPALLIKAYEGNVRALTIDAKPDQPSMHASARLATLVLCG